MVFGELHGKKVLMFKGRIHPLEGYRSFYHSWLGYLVALLGCQLLVSTNSCGAILTSLQVGDVMIMEDHLNCSNLPLLNAALIDDKFRQHQTYL
jgi:purine-nucleoside phosphorylase